MSAHFNFKQQYRVLPGVWPTMKLGVLLIILGFLASIAAIISNAYHGFYREAFEHTPAYVFEQHLFSKSIVIHLLYALPFVLLSLYKKRRKLLWLTLFQYAFIQLAFFCLLHFKPSFYSKDWLAFKEETLDKTDNGWANAMMVEDLLESELLIGKKREAIHKMLGLPNEVFMPYSENYTYAYPPSIMGAYLRFADDCHGFKVLYDAEGICWRANFLCHDHKH